MDLEEFLKEWHNESPTVLVHTSGSTGKPKPLWVEKRRMEASARITCNFLDLHEGDKALLCLPLDYIAGKMMVVRSLVRGLKLQVVEPSGTPHWAAPVDFAAMVPMQIWNLLQTVDGCQRLMQIRHLIIGGGAIDETMAEQLKSFPHAVWSTYGMTETLSHIALRRLSGSEASEWYTPFEGVRVSLNDENCLMIDAPAVHDGVLVTNDMAEIRSDGSFRILGRKDNVICSGGIKIQIEEVELLLRKHTEMPLMITKCKDEKFGEAVVLLTESDAIDSLQKICQKVLPKYWCPRHYIQIESLPFTATGKPARKEAEHLASLAVEV